MINSIRLSFFLIFLISISGFGQNLYNNVSLNVSGSASLYISNSFTNQSSASYQNDATVTILGDITNNQTTTMTGTGVTNISGSATQQLLGSQSFYTHNLVLNNTSAGNSNFVFNGTNNLIVNNALTFTQGIVVTNTNNLTMNNGAAHSGSSNISHVNGFVQKIGNQAFTFPVGDGVTLRSAAISPPSLPTDAFIGKYLQTSANPLFNLALKDPELAILSMCEYWTINHTMGAFNVNVTLSWLDTPPYNCLGTTPLTDYYIGGWNGSIWKSFANGGTTGSSASGTVITNTIPTIFGPFILAKRNIPLPIILGDFYATSSNEGNLITWTTHLEWNVKEFYIERSCDGLQWEVVDKVQPKHFSSNEYSLLDKKTCNGNNYYKLTENSTDGKKIEYGVILVQNSKENIAEFNVYPNPNNGTFKVSIIGEALRYSLEITDITGKVVKRCSLINGDNTVDCSDLSSGAYLTNFKLGKDRIIKKLIIN